MIYIPVSKKPEYLAYFREQMPEFEAITEATFYRLLNKVSIYVPEFIQTHLDKKYEDCSHRDAVLTEIVVNWIAHVIVLLDLLAVANGEDPMPAELVRTAQSLSEGGLSVSYAQAMPTGETPQAIYDYLTRTAYGENAKMLIEGCLTGARGVLIV